MIYAIKGIRFTQLADLGSLKALSLSVNALAAAGDVLLAIILSLLLHTSRTGFKGSDTMITMLITFTINTGALTSICAIASLITVSSIISFDIPCITAITNQITVLPAAFVYILFYFAIGRLYCNSLLATLNARKAIRSASKNEDFSVMSANCAQTNKSFGSMVSHASICSLHL